MARCPSSAARCSPSFAITAFIAIVAVFATEPGPGLSGEGLGVTVALIVSSAASSLSLPGAMDERGAARSAWSSLGARLCARRLQPESAGYAGVYFVVVVAAAAALCRR